jgi:hypothetical protein
LIWFPVGKKKRYDSVLKNLPSKLFNWAARKTSGVELNDFTRLKAYKKSSVKTLKFRVKCTDTFLFWQKMPVLEKSRKVVQHQARKIW